MLDNVESFFSEATTPSEPENDICASKADSKYLCARCDTHLAEQRRPLEQQADGGHGEQGADHLSRRPAVAWGDARVAGAH